MDSEHNSQPEIDNGDGDQDKIEPIPMQRKNADSMGSQKGPKKRK